MFEHGVRYGQTVANPSSSVSWPLPCCRAPHLVFQTRTPRATRLSPTQPALADQASRVSFASAENLGTMSEPDAPAGFNRMNRLRQSLPLARSSSQAKLRAPGILFLQLGEETRRVHLTHELTSLDTLRALIVHMFPQRLTMAMLRSPNTALLIKDETRNVFYELEDPRDVQDRCVIKIYCKEPIYGTYPGHQHPHLANGDLRVRGWLLYNQRSRPLVVSRENAALTHEA
uniref:SRC kinase signaling inhibitor 1 n=1 Tax=Cyclopterus lumpus TaxID=8103 RepID=A0A8C2WMP9_CYCLU